MTPRAPRFQFDCSQCPGYCCSYPRIVTEESDRQRLASHLGLSVASLLEQHLQRYVYESEDESIDEWILLHRVDPIYGSVCGFLDPEARRCRVYEGRPEICRQYPSGRQCGYFDFLKFERAQQGDEDFVPLSRLEVRLVGPGS